MKKNYFNKCTAYIFLIFISHSSYAQSFINIPCINYKKGDVLNYRSSVNNTPINAYSRVKSIKDNLIEISGSMELHGQKNSSIDFEKKINDNIYLIKTINHDNGSQVVTLLTPPEPLCGKVPTKYSFVKTVKGGDAGTMPPMKSIVTLRKIGEKEINTPFGILKTIIISKTLSEQMAPDFTMNSTTTIYYAKNYGRVKTISTYIMKVPDIGSMVRDMNLNTNDNIDMAFKAQPQEEMKYKDQKTVITSSLVSYKRSGK